MIYICLYMLIEKWIDKSSFAGELVFCELEIRIAYIFRCIRAGSFQASTQVELVKFNNLFTIYRSKLILQTRKHYVL